MSGDTEMGRVEYLIAIARRCRRAADEVLTMLPNSKCKKIAQTLRDLAAECEKEAALAAPVSLPRIS